MITTQETEKQATSVLAAEAAIRAAQARLDKAKLYRDWTEIRAPISGQISRAEVTEGNLVTMGEALTSIVSQDPVCVYFDVPERVVLRWDTISKEAAATGRRPEQRPRSASLTKKDSLAKDAWTSPTISLVPGPAP